MNPKMIYLFIGKLQIHPVIPKTMHSLDQGRRHAATEGLFPWETSGLA
jgi:hypothetical protein